METSQRPPPPNEATSQIYLEMFVLLIVRDFQHMHWTFKITTATICNYLLYTFTRESFYSQIESLKSVITKHLKSYNNMNTYNIGLAVLR